METVLIFIGVVIGCGSAASAVDPPLSCAHRMLP